ncbi:MAG: recombinase family protein [Bacillaceae bacterium]|nr:recombinase family protein [Bacillaceae bacterium]
MVAKKKIAVGYVRVSTKEQAIEGYSLENQRNDIRAHCKTKGWELLDIFGDEGISGAELEKRKGLQKAGS